MPEPEHPITDGELHRLWTVVADRVRTALIVELESEVQCLALLTRGLAELKARLALREERRN